MRAVILAILTVFVAENTVIAQENGFDRVKPIFPQRDNIDWVVRLQHIREAEKNREAQRLAQAAQQKQLEDAIHRNQEFSQYQQSQRQWGSPFLDTPGHARASGRLIGFAVLIVCMVIGGIARIFRWLLNSGSSAIKPSTVANPFDKAEEPRQS